MFTLLTATFRKGLCALIFMVLAVAPLLAQQPDRYGNATRPNTLVFRLLPDQQNTARTSRQNALQDALQQVGASKILQKFPQASEQMARRRANTVDLSQIYEIEYDPKLSFAQVQRTLMATGQLAYAEPLYLREPFYQTSDPHSDSTKVTANYLKLIKAYGGWDIEKGDTNIVIGIIDTGFLIDHLDLKDNIKYNYNDPIDGIDNDGDGLVDNFAGWDFADRDNNVAAAPRWGSHGMSVAGVAAATPDNGIGLAGIGFKTKILPLKVFSSGDGSFGGGYEAIVYAARKGCKIINLSWGGEGYSQYEQDVINHVVLDLDAVVVASAGNTKRELNMYPASYTNVLSVGGSDKDDNKYKDYSWSRYIDLMAPSIDIYSTTVSNTNSYGYNWGSSFSSPMVAGAAALVRAKYPQLTAQQVMERLRMTTDNIYHLPANQPYLEMLGTGRLNIKKALLQQNLRSVRCTAFDIADKRSMQAGGSYAINALFHNILDPVSNLEVTLTSNSPFITVIQGKTTIGNMASMATADNYSSPFRVAVSQDMPINTTVLFRVGFTDGNYSDYQYFELTVNPDYQTLDANNLRITINSKGNIGYNGLNFNQGVGVQYKNGPSLLFEGGLMVGVAAGRVSDNLRNINWQNDGDFTPVNSARIHYDTPLADQEIRGMMQDIYPSPTSVGVEVKHKALAWKSAADEDYAILEYYIRNQTPDTLKNVHSGLFADWDVGVYYQNAADWDAARNMGYVYNTTGGYPVTGIKLLTPGAPLYYAIDNMGEKGSVAIEDGFSNSEKFTILSSGVTRTKANGTGNGNNVSHVVGSTIPVLAPGETRIIAFAVLAGNNLTDLQQHADAAQQKYFNIKSGPAPLAVQDTICAGTNYTWKPGNGTNYNFYADNEKTTLLSKGKTYTVTNFTGNLKLYATNADSLFESAVSPFSLSLPLKPVADFTTSSETLHANSAVTFVNKSQHGKNWKWSFGNGDVSTEHSPVYTYRQEGMYEIKLLITDVAGCEEDFVVRSYQVREPLSTNKAEMYAQLTDVFPNPTAGRVRINWAADTHAGSPPEIWFTDQVGRKFSLPARTIGAKEMEFDFTNIPNGLYIAHFTYKDTNFIKRIVLLR